MKDIKPNVLFYGINCSYTKSIWNIRHNYKSLAWKQIHYIFLGPNIKKEWEYSWSKKTYFPVGFFI